MIAAGSAGGDSTASLRVGSAGCDRGSASATTAAAANTAAASHKPLREGGFRSCSSTFTDAGTIGELGGAGSVRAVRRASADNDVGPAVTSVDALWPTSNVGARRCGRMGKLPLDTPELGRRWRRHGGRVPGQRGRRRSDPQQRLLAHGLSARTSGVAVAVEGAGRQALRLPLRPLLTRSCDAEQGLLTPADCRWPPAGCRVAPS